MEPINFVDYKTFNKFLAVMLQEKRMEQHQTLNQMAIQIGLSQQDLSNLELGTIDSPIDSQLLSKIVDAYQINSTEINVLLKMASVSRLVELIKVLDE